MASELSGMVEEETRLLEVVDREDMLLRGETIIAWDNDVWREETACLEEPFLARRVHGGDGGTALTKVLRGVIWARTSRF